jgi:hypothetical protein
VWLRLRINRCAQGGDFKVATQCNTRQFRTVEKSVTTSVRLPRSLRLRVEQKAAADGCGRNRVIVQALECYLQEDEQAAYLSEASHQSRLAAKIDTSDPAWDRMVEGDFPAP